MHPTITVRNAHLHNLQHLTVEIPKGRLVALTGVSGSGKSTLAFDILHQESLRQYLEALGLLSWGLSRPPVEAISGLPASISVGPYATPQNPRSTVGTATEISTYLRVLYARLGHRPCPACGRTCRQPSSAGPRRAGRTRHRRCGGRRAGRRHRPLPALRRGACRTGHGRLFLQQAGRRLPHLYGAGRGAPGHRRPPHRRGKEHHRRRRGGLDPVPHHAELPHPAARRRPLWLPVRPGAARRRVCAGRARPAPLRHGGCALPAALPRPAAAGHLGRGAL